MPVVLDACALLAFLRDEKNRGADDVRDMLGKEDCRVHAINVCEVCYVLLQKGSSHDLNELVADLQSIGLTPDEDIRDGLWMEAGRIKGTVGGVSLADCFAAAFAQRLGADVVTSDSEFMRIAQRGICGVRFLPLCGSTPS